MKPLNAYENAIINFDNTLGSSNSRYIDQFFMRRRQKILDIYYLPQSYFDLPERTIRNNSNKIILFNQTLKHTKNIYRDVGGYDMSYDQTKKLCRKIWEEEFVFVLIDLEREFEEHTVFVRKAETLELNVFRNRRLFD